MRVRVQVVIEPDEGGPPSVYEVAELERGALQIDTLGRSWLRPKSCCGRCRRW